MTKDPRVYLAHIVECAARIRLYISSGEEGFQRNTMIQDAVIRNFEVMGEAIKRLPEEYRTAHPEIPWRTMAGFRDVLIHGYEGVDLAKVWLAASRDLPAVEQVLSQILPPLDKLEGEIAGDNPET